MDKIKERLSALRGEADAAVERAEAAEAKCKKLELELLAKEQEITSLQHKNTILETDLEKYEGELSVAKKANEAGGNTQVTMENLTRKCQLLEDELDAAEKNVKETVEKLRQVDVKAEHYERQLQKAEQERDSWEQKFEASQAALKKSQGELDELVRSMEGI